MAWPWRSLLASPLTSWFGFICEKTALDKLWRTRWRGHGVHFWRPLWHLDLASFSFASHCAFCSGGGVLEVRQSVYQRRCKNCFDRGSSWPSGGRGMKFSIKPSKISRVKSMTYLCANPSDGWQREKSGSIITRQLNLIELLIFIDWYAKFGGRLSGKRQIPGDKYSQEHYQQH